MSHGNLSPRQKMINMMYLMLTAMLALNVSKDILNAFSNIDEGLVEATENTLDKNKKIYGQFQTRKTATPSERVIEYFKYAQEVKKRSNEICTFIQENKKEIVKKVDGKDAEAITEDGVHIMKIDAKDNKDAPAQVMVGSGEGAKGAGYKLQKKMDSFKEYCLKLIPNNSDYEQLINSVSSGLGTEDVKHADQTYKWVPGNFEHLPTAGVIAIMSGIENRVRNVESDMINYLYSAIDVGAIKFNKIEATVIPNSNYIIRGNEYNADIFIAASDTSVNPEIIIGDYEMEGNQVKWKGDTTHVPVKSGKGIYSITPGGRGKTEYKGIIKIKKPDNTITNVPFKSSYTVAPPQAVVSPTKMNVFYLGLRNPVDISVPGVPKENIQASMSNGRLLKSGNAWVAIPARAGRESIVRVYAKIGDQRKSMGSQNFRVKTVPDPKPVVANSSGGSISTSLLAAQEVVLAQLPNFLFDLKFEVVSFNMYTVIGAFLEEKSSSSNRITAEQKNLIRRAGRGNSITFENIKAKKPGGEIKDIGTISFRLK